MRKHITLLLIVSIIAISAIAGIGAWKLSHHAYNALDLAIYTQVFWNTSQGNFFTSSIQNGNYLGDHVELYIVPLSFLFKIFPSPLFLIILQTIFVFGSSLLVYALALRYLSPHKSFFVALLYLFNPLLWNMALFEFHLLTLAIPLILLVLLLYEKKSYRWFIFVSCLMLLVREDMALVLAGIGIFALIRKQSIKWWLAPLLLAIVWFVVTMLITASVNPDEYKFGAYYAWLGNTPLEIIRTVVLHPLFFLSGVFSLSNILFVFALLLVFLGLPTIKPSYLVPAILPIIPLILGRFPVQILLETHYTAVLIPILIFAAIAGIREVEKKRIFSHSIFRPLGRIIAIVVAIYSFVFLGPGFDGIRDMKHYGSYAGAANSISLPQHASIYASYGDLPLLAQRKNIFTYHWQVLGKKQFSDAPYAAIPMPTHGTFDLNDLTLFEINFLKNRSAADEYPKTYERMQNILSQFRIVSHTETVLGLAQAQADKRTVVESLVETANFPAAGTELGPIGIADVEITNREEFSSPVLKIAYMVTQKQFAVDKGFEFEIKFSNNSSLMVPVGWNLWPLHAVQNGDSFAMYIPIPVELMNTDIETIILNSREGYVTLDGLRSAHSVITREEISRLSL